MIKATNLRSKNAEIIFKLQKNKNSKRNDQKFFIS